MHQYGDLNVVADKLQHGLHELSRAIVYVLGKCDVTLKVLEGAGGVDYISQQSGSEV